MFAVAYNIMPSSHYGHTHTLAGTKQVHERTVPWQHTQWFICLIGLTKSSLSSSAAPLILYTVYMTASPLCQEVRRDQKRFAIPGFPQSAHVSLSGLASTSCRSRLFPSGSMVSVPEVDTSTFADWRQTDRADHHLSVSRMLSLSLSFSLALSSLLCMMAFLLLWCLAGYNHLKPIIPPCMFTETPSGDVASLK